MDEAVFKERLLELCEAMLASSKTGPAGPGWEGVYLPQRPAKQRTVEESLDHLRLQMKYLLFDLEATRRENRYLRQMLEGRRRTDTNTDPE
jgi:hypothetical protein